MEIIKKQSCFIESSFPLQYFFSNCSDYIYLNISKLKLAPNVLINLNGSSLAISPLK